MKHFIITALAGLGLSSFAVGAPSPMFNNYGDNTTTPLVDAVVFQNFGTFDVFTDTLPYSTSDTLYFTNVGSMMGIPGFRIDTSTATTRFSARSVVNQGTLSAQDTPARAAFDASPNSTAMQPITVSDPQHSQPLPSQVLIFSTNVVNQGEIEVGNVGLLKIIAQTFTNTYGALVAGSIDTQNDPLDTTGQGAIDYGFGYFVDPPDVWDLFWGATNVPGPTPLVPLSVQSLANSLPATPGLALGSRAGGAEVGSGLLRDYACYELSNLFDATNIYYNIVLVNTNFSDTNISVHVKYIPGYEPDQAVAELGKFPDPHEDAVSVQFAVAAQDVITGDTVTNAFYLTDIGATLTNIVLYGNTSDANNYGRPVCFNITTTTPFGWDGGTSVPETNFAPNVQHNIYLDGTTENANVAYTAGEYGAQIGRDPENLSGGFGSLVLPDPTNDPGRIEITASQADLTQARIRAEGTVILNVTNLIGGGTGASDWGVADASIGSSNGSLSLNNFFPTSFHRARGTISAWCATWQNIATNITIVGTNQFIATNYLHMHLLVVDQNVRGNFQPSVRNLTLNGAQTVNVQSDLTVINQSAFNTTNLVLNANVTLTQNAGSLYPSNAPTLQSLYVNTNGSLSVDNVLAVGYDVNSAQNTPTGRKYTVSNIVNLGSISGAAPLFQTQFFTNEGYIFASGNGSIAIYANQMTLGSLNSKSTDTLESGAGVSLSANSILATNSMIYAGEVVPGGLSLYATTNLSDGVSSAPSATPNLINYWETTAGFSLPVKPATGDLYGTEILSIADNFTVANHTWAGIDYGTNSDGTVNIAGFHNNEVIGHLILDRKATNTVLVFNGATQNNAMYVDYLELDDFSFTQYTNGMAFNNMKIYFANANADPFKLMQVYPGKFIWASNFWGPNSSALVKDSVGDQCLMNAGWGPYLYNTPTGFVFPGTDCPVLGDPDALRMLVFSPITSATKADQEAWLATCAPTSVGSNVTETVLLSVTGSGKISSVPASKLVPASNSGTVIATAAKGWFFKDWTVSGVSTSDTQMPTLNFKVLQNAVITANFITNPFTPLAGVYNGLFSDTATNPIPPNSAGFFTLTLQPSGAFSGRLFVGPSTYTFASQFYGDGVQQVQAVSGKQSLPVNLQLDMSGASGQITGDVNGGSWDSTLLADRAPVWTAKNPSPLAGTYTIVLIPNDSNLGDSYGVAKVSKLGIVSVTGTLADNVTFNQTAPISKNGQWPFYTYASAGKDTLAGWVSFVNLGELTGTYIVWGKAASSGRYYPAGFETVNQLVGSLYTPPKKNTPALTLNDPEIILDGGNLSESVTNPVTLQKNLTYISSNITLTINAATGVFSGKFGLGHQPVSGVVLQNQNSARGFFLSTSGSGEVLLQDSN